MFFFSIEFHILLEKRMTLSEIVMQEPFILHRSCNYCNEHSVAQGQLILQQQLIQCRPLQDAGWYKPTCSVC